MCLGCMLTPGPRGTKLCKMGANAEFCSSICIDLTVYPKTADGRVSAGICLTSLCLLHHNVHIAKDQVQIMKQSLTFAIACCTFGKNKDVAPAVEQNGGHGQKSKKKIGPGWQPWWPGKEPVCIWFVCCILWLRTLSGSNGPLLLLSVWSGLIKISWFCF